MFVVFWEDSAVEALAELSMLHTDRWSEIDAADRDIDGKLRRSPHQFSQPVSEGLHRIVSRPLAAFFTVDGVNVRIEAVGWVH